jgi:mono/diheme cytochrome c family protein
MTPLPIDPAFRGALRRLRRSGARPWVAALALHLIGCGSSATHSEGLEPASLPAELRADYAVFAQRCSKCHSLARPLNSGISDENYWSLYVARMRRQPGSGISQEDASPILRFLHYYSLEQLRKNEKAVPPPVTSGSTLSGAPLPDRM